jgi:hypothetical protein
MSTAQQQHDSDTRIMPEDDQPTTNDSPTGATNAHAIVSPVLRANQTFSDQASTEESNVQPESPAEEPMPTEDECFVKHLSPKLLESFEELPVASREAFLEEHSVKALAIDTELAKRAVKPEEDNLTMMKNIASQFNKSNEQRQSWQKTYTNFIKRYEEVEKNYLGKLEELHTVVRTYVHEQLDKQQRIRLLMQRERRQLSKGRKKNFWKMVYADDVSMFSKTLETVEDVTRASYSIHNTKHTDTPKLALLCALVDNHPNLPTNGAHRILGALLEKYRDFFADTDIEATKQHIVDSGWTNTREECLAVLMNAL